MDDIGLTCVTLRFGCMRSFAIKVYTVPFVCIQGVNSNANFFFFFGGLTFGGGESSKLIPPGFGRLQFFKNSARSCGAAVLLGHGKLIGGLKEDDDEALALNIWCAFGMLFILFGVAGFMLLIVIPSPIPGNVA